MKQEVLVFSFEDAFKICYKIEKRIDLAERIDFKHLNSNESKETICNTILITKLLLMLTPITNKKLEDEAHELLKDINQENVV